ncbi:hypothetical protein GCK72_025919 [Caenorhabditis remanei]|uniref:Uncharacterized protein n=1 Tax=Caenorhabditis remanei TaxID=31234 RepID=A0A6A5G410_CAERE|nr:hypothetical protein GCK72_025919 [Caenorhabditis remanei]KAF1749451.1 hypothetical protein GCK72_025919 [Caenorhabditis remanei]
MDSVSSGNDETNIAWAGKKSFAEVVKQGMKMEKSELCCHVDSMQTDNAIGNAENINSDKTPNLDSASAASDVSAEDLTTAVTAGESSQSTPPVEDEKTCNAEKLPEGTHQDSTGTQQPQASSTASASPDVGPISIPLNYDQSSNTSALKLDDSVTPKMENGVSVLESPETSSTTQEEAESATSDDETFGSVSPEIDNRRIKDAVPESEPSEISESCSALPVNVASLASDKNSVPSAAIINDCVVQEIEDAVPASEFSAAPVISTQSRNGCNFGTISVYLNAEAALPVVDTAIPDSTKSDERMEQMEKSPILESKSEQGSHSPAAQEIEAAVSSAAPVVSAKSQNEDVSGSISVDMKAEAALPVVEASIPDSSKLNGKMQEMRESSSLESKRELCSDPPAAIPKVSAAQGIDSVPTSESSTAPSLVSVLAAATQSNGGVSGCISVGQNTGGALPELDTSFPDFPKSNEETHPTDMQNVLSGPNTAPTSESSESSVQRPSETSLTNQIMMSNQTGAIQFAGSSSQNYQPAFHVQRPVRPDLERYNPQPTTYYPLLEPYVPLQPPPAYAPPAYSPPAYGAPAYGPPAIGPPPIHHQFSQPPPGWRTPYNSAYFEGQPVYTDVLTSPMSSSTYSVANTPQMRASWYPDNPYDMNSWRGYQYNSFPSSSSNWQDPYGMNQWNSTTFEHYLETRYPNTPSAHFYEGRYSYMYLYEKYGVPVDQSTSTYTNSRNPRNGGQQSRYNSYDSRNGESNQRARNPVRRNNSKCSTNASTVSQPVGQQAPLAVEVKENTPTDNIENPEVPAVSENVENRQMKVGGGRRRWFNRKKIKGSRQSSSTENVAASATEKVESDDDIYEDAQEEFYCENRYSEVLESSPSAVYAKINSTSHPKVVREMMYVESSEESAQKEDESPVISIQSPMSSLKSEPEPEPEPELEPELESRPEPTLDSGSNPEKERESEPEAEAGKEPESELESEPKPDSEETNSGLELVKNAEDALEISANVQSISNTASGSSSQAVKQETAVGKQSVPREVAPKKTWQKLEPYQPPERMVVQRQPMEAPRPKSKTLPTISAQSGKTSYRQKMDKKQLLELTGFKLTD